MKFIKEKKKYAFLGIILFSFYILLGAVVPFIKKKRVGKKFKQSFSFEDFLGKEESVDRASLVETNLEAFDIRIAMFEEAKERIILSTFDIRDGESTNDIFASVMAAADRGVKVQIIVDGFSGSFHMNKNMIFEAVGGHSNIEIKFYNVPVFLKPWRINGRMHDKYIIIDDKLLLMGGRNTFDYFLGDYPDKVVGYDREVLIYNTQFNTAQTKLSVICQVDNYFQNMWKHSSAKIVLNKKSAKSKKMIAAVAALRKVYEKNCAQKPQVFLKKHDWKQETVSISKAAFMNNPTNILSKEPYVWHTVLQLMLHAQSRVIIHTPYALLSKEMYAGLRRVSEHVHNTVMLINSAAVGDNLVASSDYFHNKDKILATGIQVYEYFGKCSSHGKSILIDDNISIIGSYNFDMRSTYVNTETMLVIHGEEFNQKLNEKITDLLELSLEVNREGGYRESSKVQPREISSARRICFHISSRLVQLVRYLT